MKPNILFISAGAGSGKTYRLTEYLQEELGQRRIRPEAVIATTFTRKAANELVERVREKLVESGRFEESVSIGQSLIGTVNGICGRLLARYAFEAGLSPDLEVIEEDGATMLFGEALEQTTSLKDVRKMQALGDRLCQEDWHQEVRRTVGLARSNDIDSSALPAMGERSVAELLQYFPAKVSRDLDAELLQALRDCIEVISGNDDETQGTKGYLKLIRNCLRQLEQKQLPWSSWVKLSKKKPTKRSLAASEPVREIALLFDRHPKLHDDIREWILSIFDHAARTMATYQTFKVQRGLMDFVDQEKQVLDLLDLPEVAESLRQELDLLMVDEFQDTSPIQLALFLKLAYLARKSVWVGDIKQAVYSFRGSDPALMEAVLAGLQRMGSEVEILPNSWRSRPQLVYLVNHLFVPAFADILNRDQVVLTPSLTELSPHTALEFWSLDGSNQEKRAGALAAGIAELLAEGRQIVDKNNGQLRPLNASDIAVLSRTHNKVAEYAGALAALGIPVSFNRAGLLRTPEACYALACLRYLTDPTDTLASAEIISLKEGPAPEAWLKDRLDFLATGHDPMQWGVEGELTSSALQALADNRRRLELLSPTETFELCLQAGEVERTVIGWGPTHTRAMQRLANIEAMRVYVAEYEDFCLKERSAATAGGLLIWISNLADSGLDMRGRDEKVEAVQVLTHHAAKGLEWPVVISADLESKIRSGYWGLSMATSGKAIAMNRPLANRMIRYWVKPFGQQSANVAVYDAIATSDISREDLARQVAENIRLLYVSFTRARDLLVLPLSMKAKSRPWLDCLAAECLSTPMEPELILSDGQKISCCHRILQPLEEAAASETVTDISWHPSRRPLTAKLPAVISPSDFEAVPEARIGDIVQIGARLTMRGKPDMQSIGDALHAIIAADFFMPDKTMRGEMIDQTLKRYGMAAFLENCELADMLDNLQERLTNELGIKKYYPEWPIQTVRENGQLVKGWIDLAAETDKGWLLIDHKSFPGNIEELKLRALEYSGQLAAYKAALEKATEKPVLRQWIHFAVAGQLVEVVLQ